MAGLVCPVREQALQQAGRTALLSGNRRLSYADLDAHLNALEAQLQVQGLVAGDHLLAVAPNGLPLLLLAWACVRLGLVFCPLNPAIPPAERRRLAELLDARAVWASDGEPAGYGMTLSLDFSARQAASGACPLDEQRLCDLILTSGSSGTPKAAGHALAQHWASAAGSASCLPLQPGNVWLLSLPLFHVGGYAILFRCFLAGAAIALNPAGWPLPELLRRLPISHLSLVPTQLYRLLHSPGFHFSQTRVHGLLLGGAPIPQSLVIACHAQGLRPLVSYGLSEMASQVCTGEAGPEAGAVGMPLPGREVSLQQGEICVRGATLFLGYYSAGHLECPLDADGWFHTRDMGHWNAAGQLVVCGRRDNQFISGGENIQPEAIEQQLIQHPAVGQALVVPVPDAEWGQRPACFLLWQAPPVPWAELEAWLRQRLPGFMVPDYWLDWPSTTDQGLKLQRGQFAQLACRQLAL